MDIMEEEALLANVKSITDRLNIVDQIFAKAKMGIDMVMVFVCGASGLYYPGDYIKEWGRKWGIGLGIDPVSESLQSAYHIAPPMISNDVRTFEQIMHPLQHSCAQMDFSLVEKSIAEANMAVPMLGDESMNLRAPILREKQLVNPSSMISRFSGMSLKQIEFEVKKFGGFR